MSWTREQLGNAAIIVGVGNDVGANDTQLLASIETALVESSLRNLNYGDRDSKGLFQQRPSQGWGSVAQIMTPVFAARSFFVGISSNRGALSVSQAGTAGQIAQRVQRSAFPTRYDQRQADALAILALVGAGVSSPDDSGEVTIGTGGAVGELAADDGASDASGSSLLIGGSILATLLAIGAGWWVVDWLTD